MNSITILALWPYWPAIYIVLFSALLFFAWHRRSRKTKTDKKTIDKVYYKLQDLLRDIRTNCFREYLKAKTILIDLADCSPNDVSSLYKKYKSYNPAGDDSWNTEMFPAAKFDRKQKQRLLGIRGELRYQDQSLQEFLHYYSDTIKDSETEYHQNILRLSRMHDELAQYVQMKNFDKTTGLEWYQEYFSIFGNWFRNGSNQNIEHTYKEIVQKIIALNTINRSVPFVIQTTENTLRCDYAYRNICSLNSRLKEKVATYAYWNRLAYRTLRVILSHERPRPARLQAAPTLAVVKEERKRPEDDMSTVDSEPQGWQTGRSRTFRMVAGSLVFLLFCTLVLFVFLRKGYKRELHHDEQDNIDIQSPPDSPQNGSTSFDLATPEEQVYGIDISRYQGKIMEELDSLSPLHFIICKATEGGKEVDPDFLFNWHFIRSKQFVRGAYHFYHNNVSVEQQARHFTSAIKDLQPDDIPPIIDIEGASIKTGTVNKNKLNRDLLDLLEMVHRQTGRKPIIYSNLAFINEFLLDDSLVNYGLWIAEYSNRTAPVMPPLWQNKEYVFWQKTDRYSVDSKETDFDIFNGSRADLKKFLLNN